MTDQERKEFRKMATDVSRLQTDVALIHQSQEKIVEPTLQTILNRMDDLSFYSKEEVDEKINDVRIDINSKMQEMQKRRWYENTISALAGSIITTVITYLVLSIVDKN